MKKKELAVVILGAAVLFLLFAYSYFNEEVLLGPGTYQDSIFACLDAGAGPPLPGITCYQQTANEAIACGNCCISVEKDCKRKIFNKKSKDYETCEREGITCLELCAAQKKKVERNVCEEDNAK